MKKRLIEFCKHNWLAIVLAIVPSAILWYFFQRDTHQLGVTIIADVPVVTVRETYGDQIELRYKGEIVNGLRALEIEVKNSGSIPIERVDFDTPVRFFVDTGKFSDPVIESRQPNSLNPTLRASDSAVLLDPLLLNPGDRFVFRSFVVGGSKSKIFNVEGRIKGISEISVQSDTHAKWSPLFDLIATLSSSVISVISLGILAYRGIRLGSLRREVATVSSRIDTQDEETVQRAAQFAQEFGILGHDNKATILFLRLRIENLLKELGRMSNLPMDGRPWPMRRLASELAQRGLIKAELVGAIADLSPALNRELHEIESYLSAEEFASLERLALDVVAGLSTALESAVEVYRKAGTPAA